MATSTSPRIRGDLQIVALTPSGNVKPIVQVVGLVNSELTGPALNPAGTHLYFSSRDNPGVTFEIEGPFIAQDIPPLPAMGGVGRGIAIGALAAIAALRMRVRRADAEVDPRDA